MTQTMGGRAQQLRAAMTGTVVTPQDPDYAEA